MPRELIRHHLPIVGRIVAILALAAGTLGVPAGVAAADAPGRCSSAVPVARNTWVNETISTSTDVDWFRFSTTAGSRTLITLGHLAADYDLYLYSGCSTLLASSHRSGRGYDEIYRYLAAGTYRLKVVGYAGAHSPTAYALRIRPIAWGITVLSSTTWTDAAGYLHVAGEVLNNTADNRRWIEIDATFRNSAGVALALRGRLQRRGDATTVVAKLVRDHRAETGWRTRRRASRYARHRRPASCLAGQVTTAPGTAAVDHGGRIVDRCGRSASLHGHDPECRRVDGPSHAIARDAVRRVRERSRRRRGVSQPIERSARARAVRSMSSAAAPPRRIGSATSPRRARPAARPVPATRRRLARTSCRRSPVRVRRGAWRSPSIWAAG